MLILVDGPEKAGKTTLVNYLNTTLQCVGYETEVVHQGPWTPDDRIIAGMVKQHSQDRMVHIWDRGWPSEEVYASLLGRNRRARHNAFLMEWLHGRATPYKYILLPNDGNQLISRRDSSDLPVNVFDEIEEYKKYEDYGYRVLTNDYQNIAVDANAFSILVDLQKKQTPHVFGNPDAKVWFVAKKDEGCKDDRWMPLSYDYALRAFQQALGPKAMQCAFMFARLGNPALLSGDKIVTAIGVEAAEWVRYYVPASAFPKLHRLKKYDLGTFQNHLMQLKEQI